MLSHKKCIDWGYYVYLLTAQTIRAYADDLVVMRER
jgi:hypothetical protein